MSTTTTKRPKVSFKNIEKEAKNLSLNEIVFITAKKMTNEDIAKLLNKIGRKHSLTSLRWYASKARAGVRR